MRLTRQKIGILFFGGLVTGVITYLTFYCASLNRKIENMTRQYDNLLVHSMEISKNIETVRDSLDQLEQTSIKFSHLENEQRKGGRDRGDEREFMPRTLYFLQQNYENLHHIINHLQRSTYAIKLSSSRANSIPSILPTMGRMNSHYGVRVSPVSGKTRVHKGIDLAAAIGTPVYATANGIVDFSGWNGRYGNSIIIKHGFGFKTRYAHVSAIYAKKGAFVKRGQVVAAVGRTGSTTGAHLHYEVLLNNNHINPLPFIEQEQLKLFVDNGTEGTNIVFAHDLKARTLLQPQPTGPTPMPLKVGLLFTCILALLLVLIILHHNLRFFSNLMVRITRRKQLPRTLKAPVEFWGNKQDTH